MADINLMATNIKSVLVNVPGIKEAFDHEPQSISQFPAATVYFDGFGQTEQTTRSNSINWNWIIRVYISLNTSDIKQPQMEIRELIKNTINQFRSDITLGNSCLFHTLGNGEVSALLEQNNPLMIAELTLTATTNG
jgi:hypothetical protein